MSSITYNSVEAEAIIAELKERFTELEAENARLEKERDELDHEFGGEHRLYLTCKQELLAAQLRINELREALAGMLAIEAEVSSLKAYNTTVKKANKALAAPDATPELDALMRDAARYQWLRGSPTWIGYDADYRPDEVDAVIDAAIKETKK